MASCIDILGSAVWEGSAPMLGADFVLGCATWALSDTVVALSGWMERGVPAIGALAGGGGVCVSCMLGAKAGVVVLLSLLMGFFPFLFLTEALGAISPLWLGVKKISLSLWGV